MNERVEVVVVGAGPTGLMLGCWLARAGVKALIVDAKAGPANESRAVGVQARTMETYDMLGLGDRALAEGTIARGAAIWMGGHRVAGAVLEDPGSRMTPHPYMFVMGQDRTERMLLEDLRAHGGDVAYGTRCEGLTQDARGASVVLASEGSGHTTVEARYVCGCDGAKSPVRHALGLAFSGGTYAQRFFVADVVADGPLAHDELGLCLNASGFLAFFPMRGARHFRVIGIVPADLAERPDLAFDDVRAYVGRRSGMAVGEALWFATYNVHHRVAERFRVGRVFLAGDAGHVHSPVGAQGMNTGLMDATNLAWKLGAVLRGAADERLLDSYEPERMPFARLLVASTDRVFTLVSSPLRHLAFARDLAVFTLFSLVTQVPSLRRELLGRISQTRIHYRESPLSQGQAGRVHAGDRLPWVRYADGTSNFDALRMLRPHFQVYGEVSPGLAAFVAGHPAFPLVQLPDGPPVRAAGLAPGACYWLRPDGYVAYATPHFEAAHFRSYVQAAWGVWVEALGADDARGPHGRPGTGG